MAKKTKKTTPTKAEVSVKQPVTSSESTTLTAPQFKVSDGFAQWLAMAGGSLVFTARRLGKVFSVGLDAAGDVAFFERSFPQPTGLHVQGSTLLMGDKFRIWRFENALSPGATQPYDGFDAVYLPEMMYRTGNVDGHDVAILKNGMIAFAATGVNCIGGCTATHSFAPLWQPPFISGIVYEDRCHLNGLAVEGGAVKYVTALSQSDTVEGWRHVRADGGVLIDVVTGEVVLDDLSMPHSPCLHGGKLWLVNSGTGEIGTVDMVNNIFIAKANVPGFARGLAFVGDTVVTATSKLRGSDSFQTLPLEASLKAAKTPDVCGLFVLDTLSGEHLHSITIENDTLEEIYDVAFVPGVKRMMLGGLQDDLSEKIITILPIQQRSRGTKAQAPQNFKIKQ